MLLCIALGLMAATLVSYSGDAQTGWWGYSMWSRRWILFIGVISIGILARILLRPNRANDRKDTNRDAAR
jgi:hypothetical protein